MPIRPRGAVLYFPTLGVNVIADTVVLSFDNEFFDRQEFSNERLRQAKNADGSKASYIEVYGGKLIQVMTTCTSNNTARSLLPDDANIDNIKRRWDIRRYRITGLTSLDASVNLIYNVSVDHLKRIDRFQAHIAQAAMDLSYDYLISMQSEAFSYITSTSFNLYGDPISPVGSLLSGASIGATSISTDVAASLVVGQSLIINQGQSNAEVIAATSLSSNTVGCAALVNNHSTSEPVQLYETNMLISDFNPNVEKVIPLANGGFTVRKTWEMTIEHRDNKTARSST